MNTLITKLGLILSIVLLSTAAAQAGPGGTDKGPAKALEQMSDPGREHQKAFGPEGERLKSERDKPAGQAKEHMDPKGDKASKAGKELKEKKSKRDY